MNPNNYLKKLLTTIPSYQLSSDDKNTIKFEGIGKYVFNKLNSSKFKGSSIPKSLGDKVELKIEKSIESEKPIHITFPFGGYKKWQLPTYPYPDWSEVFCITLLREYLAPIASAYKNGVVLEFFSDEIFVSRMNNYPQKDLDKYNDQFKDLVKWFSKYLPANFEIKSSKIRDQITQDELMKRFDKEIVKLKKEWDKLPKNERDFRLKKTARNYKGDLSKLSKKEKDNILFESTLVHDAFIFGDWESGVPWAFGEMMIPLGNRYTGEWGIHIKSSRSSTVQFWIGIGVLEKRGKEYIPTSYTYEQFLKVKNKLKEEKVSLFPQEFVNLRKMLVK